MLEKIKNVETKMRRIENLAGCQVIRINYLANLFIFLIFILYRKNIKIDFLK